jgi:hypothetical protein
MSTKKESFDFVIKEMMNKLNIGEVDAMNRLAALIESGILNQGHPTDPISKIMIDSFLTSDRWDKPEYQKECARIEGTKTN